MEKYVISARAPLARCSTYTMSRVGGYMVHDAPTQHPSIPEDWEGFDTSSIPGYIAHAMRRIYANLERLEDLDEPYLLSQASELQFMIDAVLAARSTLG